MDDGVYLIKRQTQLNSELIQYATLYWMRLKSIMPHVRETAEMKWEKDHNLVFVNNILDTKPHQMTVVIGTLFKEMPLKPSILKNIVGTLGTRKFKNGQYISEEDYAVLEDMSGRVRIKKGEVFSPDNFITGSIVDLKGIVDKNGFFDVKDYCYAGIPFSAPVPRNINLNTTRGLYDDLEGGGREFIAFVSGLEFGEPGDIISSELLLRFLRGEMFSGPQHVKLASLITRVVICGNSIVQPEETD
jgi:DNA polymerase delta subunit 2